ncbi:hypothetical protein P3L10_004628 [Capsicum annuum]
MVAVARGRGGRGGFRPLGVAEEMEEEEQEEVLAVVEGEGVGVGELLCSAEEAEEVKEEEAWDVEE